VTPRLPGLVAVLSVTTVLEDPKKEAYCRWRELNVGFHWDLNSELRVWAMEDEAGMPVVDLRIWRKAPDDFSHDPFHVPGVCHM
jgi:hypothetical protein